MTDTDTGAKTVKLAQPLKTGDGRLLADITLRPPLVKDLKAAQRQFTETGDQEIALLASLAGVHPEDLDNMLLADYQRLQNSFRELLA